MDSLNSWAILETPAIVGVDAKNSTLLKNAAVLFAANLYGQPSEPADKGNRSNSSNINTRTLLEAKLAGELAPAKTKKPPGKFFLNIVFPDDLLFSSIKADSFGVSLKNGLNFSLLVLSAIWIVGATHRIWLGS